MDELLACFPPITLEQMHGIKLMNRIDTKFVTTRQQLCRFLELARGYYYVQDFHGRRQMPYHTIYLDTPDKVMYATHHSGRKHRYKVRMRMYENDHEAFLEVKNKNNHGRTKKKRMSIPSLVYEGETEREFAASLMPYDAAVLEPVIENRFRRITLVNKMRTERLTIDLDIWFHNLCSGNDRKLDEHVIIELKRDGLIPSPAIDLLKRLRIKKGGFSKYAIGMAMTDSSLKQNLFKERIRYIEGLVK